MPTYHTHIKNSIEKLENRHVSGTNGTFMITDHILGHKLSLNNTKTPRKYELPFNPSFGFFFKSWFPWKH